MEIRHHLGGRAYPAFVGPAGRELRMHRAALRHADFQALEVKVPVQMQTFGRAGVPRQGDDL